MKKITRDDAAAAKGWRRAVDRLARALDGKLAVETATGREVLFPSPEDVDAETNGGGFRPASRAEALAYAVEWAEGR